MRYLATIFLSACCTVQEPTIKVVDNPEKDKYIAKLETEASDGASALSVASKNVEGKGKGLIELTQVRLAGIKEPTVAKVAEYQKAMLDPALLAKERERAAKVQAEADRLQMEADRLDEENRDLRETLEAAQKDKAWGELRTKFFSLSGIFAIGGAGMFVMSTFTAGKGRMAGLFLVLLSVFFGGAPFVIRDVVESVWFAWTAIALSVLGGLWGIIGYLHNHREIKSRLTEPKNTTS